MSKPVTRKEVISRLRVLQFEINQLIKTLEEPPLPPPQSAPKFQPAPKPKPRSY